ncbi:MAG: hypothetical protein D6820_05180, partial [Lentisphaerae bacterium]
MSSSKVILFLTDGLDYCLVHRYLNDMPNTCRIIREGFHGRILPFTSTWGNINFDSLLTGTAPGTHYRIEDGAETLWQALERDGRRTALIDPGCRVETGDRVLKIACAGPAFTAYQCGPRVFQTPDVTDGIHDLAACNRSGWPPGGGPTPNRSIQLVHQPRRVGGVLQTHATILDGVELCLTLDDNTITVHNHNRLIATANTESWSDWTTIRHDAELFAIRFKLLHCHEASFALQASSAFPLSKLAPTPTIRERLLDCLGPYFKGTAIPPRPDDPAWESGVSELFEQATWVVNAARIMLGEFDVDLVVHKNFIVDAANHQCAAQIDPTYHRYNPETAFAFDEVLHKSYTNFDRIVGQLLDVASELGNTHVVIAGDHGICVNNWVCDINARLHDAGWLRFDSRGNVDEQGSKVFTKRSRQGNEIFINPSLAEEERDQLRRKV